LRKHSSLSNGTASLTSEVIDEAKIVDGGEVIDTIEETGIE